MDADSKPSIVNGSEAIETKRAHATTCEGGDVAAEIAKNFANEPPYDNEEEKRLRWKIDLRLIPLLFLNITLPALDKVTPSTGALYGLREDLKLKGSEYAWVGSSFYVSLLRLLGPTSMITDISILVRSLATYSGASLLRKFCSDLKSQSQCLQ